MYYNNKILVGKNQNEEFFIVPKMANRHGLIAGGTGSGKTITLKVLAESFSNAGVPVFLADVKGDLAGMCELGVDSEDMQKRIEKFSLNEYGFEYQKFPTQFFDIDRKYGLPLRISVSSFGPTLLSHILELNQTQSDILNVMFKIADDEGLLLLDLKDLKKLMEYVSNNSNDFASEYGKISKTSVQAILRAMVSLEQEGINDMFGEPELDIADIIKTDAAGKGIINILHSANLVLKPTVYSSFLLWLLSEIYESMPEVGDLDKPKFIFFFDEAHLLFNNTSKPLLKIIDQMTKLIRSKGIGLYFITQDPIDIPDTILQQLGNKIQHVHRAYTAKDKRNHKAICDSFRDNEKLDLPEILETLGTGEALISFLDEKGIPNIVNFAKILPPQSKIGTIDNSVRDNVIKSSILYSKYSEDLDRESAYEVLSNKMSNLNIEEKNNDSKKESKKDKEIKKVFRNVARSTGGTVGREIVKSIFGSKSSTAKTIASNIGASVGRNILGTFFK